MKYLIAFGNPVDGFGFIGPFDSAEDANEYAEHDRDLSCVDWWVVELIAPEPQE